jgi:hypothetical protein
MFARGTKEGRGRKKQTKAAWKSSSLLFVCADSNLLCLPYENDDDDSCEEQLEDDEDGISGSEVLDISIHARQDVGDGLTDGDHDSEKLLGTLEQLTILLVALVNLHTETKQGNSKGKQTVQQMRKKTTERPASCFYVFLIRTWMILLPASNCMTSPEVTMGEIPSSMRVPRLDARMTRIQ